MVTLIPLAMVAPNSAGIYAPSRLRQKQIIKQEKFLERYADHSHSILVSFEPDGVSNPHRLTAYGYGLDCWWLVEVVR